VIVALLFFVLPIAQGAKQVTLNYSQSTNDVSAHKGGMTVAPDRPMSAAGPPTAAAGGWVVAVPSPR
jgi:hypothetical protein